MAVPFAKIAKDIKTIIGTNATSVSIDQAPDNIAYPYIILSLIDAKIEKKCCGNFIAHYNTKITLYDKSANQDTLITKFESIYDVLDNWQAPRDGSNNSIFEVNPNKIGYRLETFIAADNVYSSTFYADIISTKR
jgi:hypothetical protein